MIGHTATRLLRHAPRIDATTGVTNVQRFVVFRDSQRSDAGRLCVILAVVRRVHGELGAENQLTLPFEAFLGFGKYIND